MNTRRSLIVFVLTALSTVSLSKTGIPSESVHYYFNSTSGENTRPIPDAMQSAVGAFKRFEKSRERLPRAVRYDH